jgi:uncharacterized tellurite resistance protein B-like protein
MDDDELILSLARVVVASAWADGTIQAEEINSLKDLLFRIPNLTEDTWRRLDMYIDSPVSPAERDELLNDLAGRVRTDHDKQLVHEVLSSVLEADGSVSADERRFLDEAHQAVGAVRTGWLATLGRVVRPRLDKRSEICRSREVEFEDYIHNRVFWEVSRRADSSETTSNMDDAALRKCCLAGAMMARIAHVDREVTDAERDQVHTSLVQYGKMAPEQAAVVANVALSEAGMKADEFRTKRRFYDQSTVPERILFITSLFAVAAADGDPSHDEIEEIRQIADGLRITHTQFISAKVDVLG